MCFRKTRARFFLVRQRKVTTHTVHSGAHQCPPAIHIHIYKYCIYTDISLYTADKSLYLFTLVLLFLCTYFVGIILLFFFKYFFCLNLVRVRIKLLLCMCAVCASSVCAARLCCQVCSGRRQVRPPKPKQTTRVLRK